MSANESHEARLCLGAMLRLVEDGILVRNIDHDGNLTDYVEKSIRLTGVLRAAQEALK